MRVVVAAPSWPSTAPHPAERALQDSLLHFYGYQAGHQTSQRVVDDRREGHLKTTDVCQGQFTTYLREKTERRPGSVP